ncbi:MAG: lysophospholipid acyltransferase family protein [Moraxellaceae bacterium]|nr:lysophospholipid acyltransferase family protein [Moraxellaceae bacterium]
MFSTLSTECRAAWRLARLGFHLLRGMAIVRWRFPHWDTARKRCIKQAWSQQLIQLLGLRLTTTGTTPTGSALIVSNHISWLDIFVLNAATQTHFVCKDEVRDWPIIGWLVEHTDTLFIARGSRSAAARASAAVLACLREQDQVVVFPEGTTTNGLALLPFRPALFQAAVDAPCPVQPALLRYLDTDGRPSLAPAYDGDITLWECLRAVTKAPYIVVQLEWLGSVDASDGRRPACQQAEALIAQASGLPQLASASSSD